MRSCKLGSPKCCPKWHLEHKKLGIEALEKTRLRIRFTKAGDLRWIGHRDLARVWERLLRRANLQLAFSQGFHPKPRISFPSALALGIEALEEVVELEIVGELNLSEIQSSIEKELPVGMELLSLESPTYALGKAKVLGGSFRIELPPELVDSAQAKIAALLEEETIEVAREKKTITCDRDDPLFDLRIDGRLLSFSIPHNDKGSIRPSELLELLGLDDLLASGATLQRTKVHLKEPEVKEEQPA